MKQIGIALVLALAACGDATKGSVGVGGAVTSFSWPPVVGKPYPDLALKNHLGEDVRLSDFRGRTLLIEPIGMT